MVILDRCLWIAAHEVSLVCAKVAVLPAGASSGRSMSGATVDDDTTQDHIFSSFAEHLVPEAFATPTRAYRVTYETAGPAPADRAKARARFGRWIDDRIEDALAASWPHDRPLVVAFTSDGALHPRATTVTREFHRMLYRHPARRLHPLRRR